LVLIVLFITLVVWVFIPENGEQIGPSQQAQTPLEETPDMPSDQPADTKTDPIPPPSSAGIATTDGSLPVNASPPATTSMPSDAAPQSESVQPPAAPAGELADRSVSAVSEKNEPAGDGLSEVALSLQSQLQRDNKIVIHLSDDSNDLQLDTFTILGALAELLLRQPDSQVIFLGFTDASAGGNGVQKFGEFQAETVKSFLEGQGIQTNRIKTYGLDSTFTVVSNDSENGRQFNQRLEIKIIPLPARKASPPPRT
jgi:outer membrane protein OmpA-like peptidoglycan-associated protein